MGIIIVILIGIIIFLLVNNNIEKEEPVKTDATKFASKYTLVDKDNRFVYAKIDEIINILEEGTGIVYLGFPECKWCQQYVVYLNEVAKDRNVSKIYYYRNSHKRNYKCSFRTL